MDKYDFPLGDVPVRRKRGFVRTCLLYVGLMVFGFCGGVTLLVLVAGGGIRVGQPAAQEQAQVAMRTRSNTRVPTETISARTVAATVDRTGTAIARTQNPATMMSVFDSRATRTAEAGGVMASSTPRPSSTARPVFQNTARPSNTPLPPLPTLTPRPSSTPTPMPEPIAYSSAQEGMQPVIGPVTIPTGFYVMEVRTTGFIIVQPETLGGTCGILTTGGSISLSRGDASDGAETLFLSDGCEMLLAVSNTREAWSITFTPFDSGAPRLPYDEPFTSAEYGLYALVGPINFGGGLFRVTATTEGFMILRIIAVSGECDTGGTLISVSRGQAADGAQATFRGDGCVGLLYTDNVTDPWEITFEAIR